MTPHDVRPQPCGRTKDEKNKETVMEDIKKNISVNLALLRKSRKITQQKLAADINYSDKAVSRWEVGDSLPDIGVLLELCEYYGVDFEWLIHSHEEAPKPKVSDGGTGIRIAIILLAAAFVFTVATIVFIYARVFRDENAWMAFIWAVPISLLFAVWFCRKWWGGLWTCILLSAEMWSVITALYLHFLHADNIYIWPLFLLGVPGQLILILLQYIKQKSVKP